MRRGARRAAPRSVWLACLAATWVASGCHCTSQQQVPHLQRPSRLPQDLELPQLQVLPALSPLAGTRLSADASGEAGQCARDTRLMEAAAYNRTLWAVRMLDASAHVHSGVLWGARHQMGSFDGCMSAAAASPVGARYCLVSLTQRAQSDVAGDRPAQRFWETVDDLPPYQDVAEVIHGADMVDGSLPLSAVRVALCVPRSCGPDALQTALRASVGRPHVDVHVRPEHCRQPDDEAEASDTGTTVFWALLAALTLAAILGPSLGWSSWDWRRHSRSLGLPDPNVSGLDLSALSGIRTLNSMYLVMLHRGIHTARCAISNKDFITSQARSRKSLTLLYRGALGVDTFFFLAGLLLALPARRQPFAKSLANRVVRVLPVYALVLLFHCTALPSLGAGPLWAEVAEPMARACRRWGWTNLLFVNNYVHGGTAEHMCMEHSWSLAVDMHMFLLSSMLLVRLPSGLARLASLAGLALLAAVPLFLGTLLGGWPATVTWTLRTMQGMWAEQHVHSAYTPTHMRAAPYLLGLLAGTALPMLQARGFRPGRLASLGLTALGLAVMAGVMCGSAPFNDASTPYAPLSAALYAGLAPVTWAVGLALVVVANVLGERTVVRALLSWQPLVTLSRLTFGVYLVSYPLQALITASKRDAVRITPLTLVGDSLSDVVLTFLVSYWLFVVLEAPLRTMAKKALATKSRSAEPSAQAAPTTKAGAEKTD